MRIGILTGGGDVPGLNASIKAATNRAVGDGHEMIGIRRGWAGLLELDPDDPETVRTHTKAVLSRLEARDRTHAVAIGLRSSLIE